MQDKKLSPLELEAVKLKSKGWKYSKIAEELGVTENRVKNLIHRAKEKLNGNLSFANLKQTLGDCMLFPDLTNYENVRSGKDILIQKKNTGLMSLTYRHHGYIKLDKDQPAEAVSNYETQMALAISGVASKHVLYKQRNLTLKVMSASSRQVTFAIDRKMITPDMREMINRYNIKLLRNVCEADSNVHYYSCSFEAYNCFVAAAVGRADVYYDEASEEIVICFSKQVFIDKVRLYADDKPEAVLAKKIGYSSHEHRIKFKKPKESTNYTVAVETSRATLMFSLNK